MLWHPDLLDPLVRQHQRRLLDGARAHRAGRHARQSTRPQDPATWRARLGWLLVECGLRLCVSAPDETLGSRGSPKWRGVDRRPASPYR